MRIIGIDPGFGRTGLGIVDLQGEKSTHVWHEVIETDQGSSFSERLQVVRNDLIECIRKFEPQAAVVETLFFSNQREDCDESRNGARRNSISTC